MKVILIRHGECSTGGCYTGRKSTVSLNRLGEKQITEIDINISSEAKLYCSALTRAKESAEIICSRFNLNNPIIDNRIDELDFGVWEGLNYTQIMEKYSEIANVWYQNPFDVTPPNGEHYRDFIDRIREFWNTICKTDIQEVVIVTHGGVIQVLSTIINRDRLENRWEYNLDRGSYRFYQVDTE